MKVGDHYHLTYCTNIHLEKDWESLLQTLDKVLPPVKDQLQKEHPFGLGLRLSDDSSRELLEGKNLLLFKEWLETNNIYVFTLNGFPYGKFHGQKIKDDVHKPDWNTQERVEYTKRLSRILAVLLPEGMEGGISTSPISYKPWFAEEPQKIKTVFKNAAINLADIVAELLQIRRDSGKIIHIDIEPEPDGFIENSDEVVQFFEKYLLTGGAEHLAKKTGFSHSVAEAAIRTHIRVCYDVCHFAVQFEDQEAAIEKILKAGIRIGKIQISAALKAKFGEEPSVNKQVLAHVKELNDPFYLHQVRVKRSDGVKDYTDLPLALKEYEGESEEWRIHYHVPIFTDSFGSLLSTRKDIENVLELLKKKNFTDHLEVETYTWEILPADLKRDLGESIVRELEWVRNKIETATIQTP